MDLDFTTNLNDGFEISIDDNTQGVEGNRALLNRFEITFMTKTKRYLIGNTSITIDNYGGNADNFINKPQVLNDIQSIAASVSVAVDKTVESIKNDEPPGIPNTEKLDSAEVIDVNIIDDVIYAQIQVNPVEVEPYTDIMFNLPIIKRNLTNV